MDADAKCVVVLILDGIEGSRLGHAGRRRKERNRPVGCRLDLRVDHVEAHIEPRREVVLGARTELPPAEVVVAGPGSHLSWREGDRADSKGGLGSADRQIGAVAYSYRVHAP